MNKHIIVSSIEENVEIPAELKETIRINRAAERTRKIDLMSASFHCGNIINNGSPLFRRVMEQIRSLG